MAKPTPQLLLLLREKEPRVAPGQSLELVRQQPSSDTAPQLCWEGGYRPSGCASQHACATIACPGQWCTCCVQRLVCTTAALYEQRGHSPMRSLKG
mmetsp:Transcript_116391/g.232063  ORF Transcript_116391/g.232063 Transcript_116391/m.232063 type:complete len:96 (-) Transcript_116391:14-301(-)